MSPALAQEAVERGIAFLDANSRPDWRGEIDVDSLNLAHGDVCVLGQLYNSYDNGVEHFDLEVSDAEALGFYVNLDFNDRYTYTMLTEAWKLALSA